MQLTKQRSCLARSPPAFRFPLHTNLVLLAQRFFAKLSRRRLKRGVFRSVDLQAAINRFVAEANADKPFTWTANPDKIVAAVKRGHQC
jgi:hypothetical protein